jgi:3',5'-cyclic AMP phosphodiesterase CpdA
MRLAHISDLHALDLHGVSPLSLVGKRALGLLNLASRRRDKHPIRIFEALMDDLNQTAPDHVLATGDVSNLALRTEFQRVRVLLDRLELSPRHITVIPGNHDRYVLASVFDRWFERVLGAYCASDDGSVEYPLVRQRGGVVVIGCSTAWPCPPPFADGWLGAAQLGRLAQLLDSHRGTFRVVALHHPPVQNRWEILRGLRDRDRFARVLEEHGAELVLHGHEHRDLRADLAGPTGSIPVIGVGSSTYNSDEPERSARYNIYTIEGGAIVGTEQRVYDPQRQRFT